MTLKQLKQILDTTGYPVAYKMFSKQTTPSLPFIVYFETNSDNFKADNRVYQKVSKINIQLYTKAKSELAQKTLEDILDQNDIVYESYEDYLVEEKVFLISYEIEILK